MKMGTSQILWLKIQWVNTKYLLQLFFSKIFGEIRPIPPFEKYRNYSNKRPGVYYKHWILIVGAGGLLEASPFHDMLSTGDG